MNILCPDRLTEKTLFLIPKSLRVASKSISDATYDPPFTLKSPYSHRHEIDVLHEKKTKKEEEEEEGPKQCVEDPKRPVKSDLPFDFRYSYSETNPTVKPVGFREPPKFSPFGPGRLDRKWTGTEAPVQVKVDLEKVAEQRSQVLGDGLSEEEVAELVERYRHSDCSRQINLGTLALALSWKI